MKKVFPNDMVAHVWAQQKQDEGRSGNGNFSFSGPTIYSYGTPIANIVTGTRKRKGALLTSQSYSVTTTGKHKNATWSAWNGNGHSIPLGHFTIDEIEPSGNVKAGCHYVTFAEVSAVADTLRAAGHELALQS